MVPWATQHRGETPWSCGVGRTKVLELRRRERFQRFPRLNLRVVFLPPQLLVFIVVPPKLLEVVGSFSWLGEGRTELCLSLSQF